MRQGGSLRIQVSWCVTLCHWALGINILKDHREPLTQQQHHSSKVWNPQQHYCDNHISLWRTLWWQKEWRVLCVMAEDCVGVSL